MGTRYEIVGSSLRTITVDVPTQPSNFSCQYINLATADQFDIEAGGIVGACVYEPSQNAREQMDIASEVNGYTLLQVNDTSI